MNSSSIRINKIARHYPISLLYAFIVRITLDYCPHNCTTIPTLVLPLTSSHNTISAMKYAFNCTEVTSPRSQTIMTFRVYVVKVGFAWVDFKMKGSNVRCSLASRLTIGVIWKQTADSFTSQCESDLDAGRGGGGGVASVRRISQCFVCIKVCTFV